VVFFARALMRLEREGLSSVLMMRDGVDVGLEFLRVRSFGSDWISNGHRALVYLLCLVYLRHCVQIETLLFGKSYQDHASASTLGTHLTTFPTLDSIILNQWILHPLFTLPRQSALTA